MKIGWTLRYVTPKLKLQEQKAKDDLQQQIIDQIGKQITDLIPQLVGKLESKKAKNGKS